VKQTLRKHNDIPDEYKTALISPESASVGTVTTTNTITLQPMEKRTLSGFERKNRNVTAAVTEPIEDTYQQKSLICPRVVELTNTGKTARIPVKICNLSAKIMRIPKRSEICQLNEVKILRNIDTDNNFKDPES
jgi:hypothetical protein